MSDAPSNRPDPIRVDLERGLVGADLFWEAALERVRRHPVDALRLPFWLLAGRASARRRLSRLVRLDPAALPYRPEVLAELERQRAKGRRIVVEAPEGPGFVSSDAVSAHLGLGARAGEAPAPRDRPGAAPSPDPPTRRIAHAAHALRGPIQASSRAAGPPHPAAGLIQAMRPYQWAKNLLLVVPLVMSHRPLDLATIVRVLMAFAAFSLAASFVYVVNDLLDLPSDRRHPRKRRRPFASGRVPVQHGLALAVGLLAVGLALSALLSARFLGLVAGYVGASLFYSVRLKRTLLLDVVVLSGLYSLRLFAGGVVAGVALSPWLLAFSTFFFLSLAFAKRYVELAGSGLGAVDRLPGRGYAPIDLDMIRSVGPTSGYLAVLVVCLYIQDASTAALYRHPERLWWVCLALLYWITRVWFLAQRGQLHDDPVLFALRDRNSRLTGAVTLLVFLAAWF